MVVVAREVMREDFCSLRGRGQAGPNPQPIAEGDMIGRAAASICFSAVLIPPQSYIPMNVPIHIL